MKRTIILSAALLCLAMTQAQNVKELEKAVYVRDSVMSVLAEHRANYARNESMREKLTPEILFLEKEVERLQAECNRILDAVTQAEAQSVLATSTSGRPLIFSSIFAAQLAQQRFSMV